jgi:hypothetical protein
VGKCPSIQAEIAPHQYLLHDRPKTTNSGYVQIPKRLNIS